MKRVFFKAVTAAVMLLSAASASATPFGDNGEPRAKFTNVGFVHSHLKQSDYPKLSSDIGVSLAKGRTYYLHKPIANMLRIGIDAVWSDVNYANYKVNEHYMYDGTSEPDVNKFTIHEIGIGMQVGPSITLNMCKRLQMSAYFRYAPTLECIYNDELNFGYGSMFTGGFSANYGVIGLGIETRFGKSKMKHLSLNFFENGGDDDDDEGYEEPEDDLKPSGRIMSTLSGLRAFICLRF